VDTSLRDEPKERCDSIPVERWRNDEDNCSHTSLRDEPKERCDGIPVERWRNDEDDCWRRSPTTRIGERVSLFGDGKSPTSISQMRDGEDKIVRPVDQSTNFHSKLFSPLRETCLSFGVFGGGSLSFDFLLYV